MWLIVPTRTVFGGSAGEGGRAEVQSELEPGVEVRVRGADDGVAVVLGMGGDVAGVKPKGRSFEANSPARSGPRIPQRESREAWEQRRMVASLRGWNVAREESGRSLLGGSGQ